jgi:GNAT superfamily N-acetyltransferase
LSCTVRKIDPSSPDELALVSSRMRSTLEEVLGEERGRSMYSLEWLRGRLLYHLDPARTSEVFVALRAHRIVGHAILRAEEDKEGVYGLFSTIYVLPEHRRSQVATALLHRGEEWMRSLGLSVAATNTAKGNGKLIGLLEMRGYAVRLRTDEMLQLARRL